MVKCACIGSREVPPEKILLMESIGEYIASNGWSVASGNAVGADQAYARGANKINPELVYLYLPWRSYENKAIVDGNKLVSITSKRAIDITTEIAAKYHPAWEHLTPGVKSLMMRNAAIVSNADVVVAYFNHNKKGGGGTGHGWRIAEAGNIPKLDISQEVSLDEVKSFITKAILK